MISYDDVCIIKQGFIETHQFYRLSESLMNITISVDEILQLDQFCLDKDRGNMQSKPMVLIGIYIAIASLVCTLAMAADLWHGVRNKKFWFPCKYFTLNAASITVIAVAMKLPVDLTDEMSGEMEQTAKLGSLAFMCTILVNLMPSLASMDSKTLLANVIGLSILVITIIVNVIIQIQTAIIDGNYPEYFYRYIYLLNCESFAYIYVAVMILLLIIMISSSLTIPTTKEILEFKYQATNKTSSIDQQQTQMSLVEKLRQHVRRFWVMAETGSPQFVMVSNPLSAASGVICVFVLHMQALVMFDFLNAYAHKNAPTNQYNSVYKRSVLFILVTQSIGVVVGTIAPMFRCSSVLSFKLVTKRDMNHLMVFKVEKYWTHKLYEWKQNHISFLLSSRRSRYVLYNLKSIALSLCIGFQKALVVLCKVIRLVPIVVLKLVVDCLAILFTPFFEPTREINEDLSMYVLQVNDEMELAERKVKGISNSMNSFILKAEKEQNNRLLELLEKSTGFDGVEKFDTDQIQPLTDSVELVNSWSLPIVSLTCIAVALPHIPKDIVENLVKSVSEGLSYTYLVEESLNLSTEYVNMRKATITLWHEVENNCKWLKNSLSENAFEGKTATVILSWFSDKAEAIVIEINKSSNGKMVEKIPKELIAANSMYRIAQTILLRDQSNTEPISKKQLFALLNGMIADILSACFTNIPQVITMKCHESVIEKREASVKAAAKLLGKSTKILERLETLELPSMDDDKMAYIDEWRRHFNQSIP